MKISTGYFVTEVFDDQCPEPFGGYVGEDVKEGDIIQLRWLDGSFADKVEVVKVDGFDLRVKAVKEAA